MTLALTTPNVDPAVADAMEVYSRLQTVKSVLAPDLSDPELQLFAFVAQRSGLDPFAKQIYAVKRGGKVTFQTGIDGYRSTAERTGEYDGSDEPEFGPEENGHPAWARVTVFRFRSGRRVGQSATAYWAEFHPGSGADSMWRKMPRNQLAKCAEALALRKAFPFVLADLYTTEEMAQADNDAAALPTVNVSARERLASRRAAAETPQSETIEGEATEVPVEAAPVAVAACDDEDASPMGLGYCAKPKGHKDAHASADGTWPR